MLLMVHLGLGVLTDVRLRGQRSGQYSETQTGISCEKLKGRKRWIVHSPLSCFHGARGGVSPSEMSSGPEEEAAFPFMFRFLNIRTHPTVFNAAMFWFSYRFLQIF